MKTAVITGATSGIGFAIAKGLALKSVRVIGVGRSSKKCDAATQNIKESVPDADVTFVIGDLSSQRDVHRIADEIGAILEAEYGGRLDALINNAGGIRNWYTTTTEGYEMQFALNHLAGFLLTYLLMPYLKKAGGRMMLTGSNSHKLMRMRWNDIMFEKHYSCLYAYKQSKLCNMLFAREFNRRFIGSGVRAYVVDPGLVNTDIGSKNTGGIVSWFWNLRKKHGVAPGVSAQTYVHLFVQEPAPKGLYYYMSREQKYSRHADNTDDAKRLFDLSEKLCGIRYAVPADGTPAGCLKGSEDR